MDKQQLAAEMGVKPEHLDGFILGLSIFVNKGLTFEQAVAKLLALWQSLLEKVQVIESSQYMYLDARQAMHKRLADVVWASVNAEAA